MDPPLLVRETKIPTIACRVRRHIPASPEGVNRESSWSVEATPRVMVRDIKLRPKPEATRIPNPSGPLPHSGGVSRSGPTAAPLTGPIKDSGSVKDFSWILTRPGNVNVVAGQTAASSECARVAENSCSLAPSFELEPVSGDCWAGNAQPEARFHPRRSTVAATPLCIFGFFLSLLKITSLSSCTREFAKSLVEIRPAVLFGQRI